jgi:hypothetical protein
VTSSDSKGDAGLTWGRAILLVMSFGLVAIGTTGLYAGNLFLTRPAGKLPTYLPGYIPGATMYHSPRYGHSAQEGGVALLAAGATLICLVVLLVIVGRSKRGDDVRVAEKQFGSDGRFVGLTESGRPIVLVQGHRLVYRRRSRYWRPRVTCPVCDTERTTTTVKVSSAADLARLDDMGAWECRSCRRYEHSHVLVGKQS